MDNPFKIISIFSLAAFAIGLSEFIVIGIIGFLLTEFNITLSQAGLLISLYALGISLGAPTVTYLTRQLNSKTLCIALLLFFAFLNLSSIFTQSFTLLLILRACSGVIHGTFFSIASAEVPSLVGTKKAAMAIALMFSGLTIAMVIGVPLCMYLVSLTSWIFPFVVISILSVLCSLLMLSYLPKNFGITTQASTSSSSNKVKTSDVKILGLYAITFFGFGGGFYFYSYIEPWLSKIVHISLYQIGFTLGIIGFGSLLGNILGGLLPQKLQIRNALSLLIIVQVICLALLSWTTHLISIQFILLFWSISTFSLAPMVQALAVTYSSNLSARISASFNVAAFNLGISFSSYISTLSIQHYGLEKLPLGGTFLVLCALPLVLLVFKYPEKNIQLNRNDINNRSI